MISSCNHKNNASDGSTSRNTLPAGVVTFAVSFVSMYSHTTDKTDVSGAEAKTAAISVIRLAMSEIATIRAAATAI